MKSSLVTLPYMSTPNVQTQDENSGESSGRVVGVLSKEKGTKKDPNGSVQGTHSQRALHSQSMHSCTPQLIACGAQVCDAPVTIIKLMLLNLQLNSDCCCSMLGISKAGLAGAAETRNTDWQTLEPVLHFNSSYV